MVALLAGVLVVSFGSGYRASQAVLDDGSAQLAKGHVVVRVNGESGQVDAKLTGVVAKGKETVRVIELPDGQLYVENTVTGTRSKVDTTTMRPEQLPAAAGKDARGSLVGGGSEMYSVDRTSGAVAWIHPRTRAVTPVAKLGPVQGAEVDSHGTAWVLAAGKLHEIRRTEQRAGVDVGSAGEQALLTLVGDRPTVLRLTAGEAVRYGRTAGDVQRARVPDLAGQPADQLSIAVPGPGDVLWVAAQQGRRLMRVDLPAAQVRSVELPQAGDREIRNGRPVVTGDRVLVPDYSARAVHVLDAATGRERRLIPRVPGNSPEFDVVARGSKVFINDQYASRGLVVDRDGTDRTIDKGTGDGIPGPRQPAPPIPNRVPTPPTDPPTGDDPAGTAGARTRRAAAHPPAAGAGAGARRGRRRPAGRLRGAAGRPARLRAGPGRRRRRRPDRAGAPDRPGRRRHRAGRPDRDRQLPRRHPAARPGRPAVRGGLRGAGGGRPAVRADRAAAGGGRRRGGQGRHPGSGRGQPGADRRPGPDRLPGAGAGAGRAEPAGRGRVRPAGRGRAGLHPGGRRHPAGGRAAERGDRPGPGVGHGRGPGHAGQRPLLQLRRGADGDRADPGRRRGRDPGRRSHPGAGPGRGDQPAEHRPGAVAGGRQSGRPGTPVQYVYEDVGPAQVRLAKRNGDFRYSLEPQPNYVDQRLIGWGFAQPAGGTTAVYRYVCDGARCGGAGTFYYSMTNSPTAGPGWANSGVAFYAYGQQLNPAMVPVRAMFDGAAWVWAVQGSGDYQIYLDRGYTKAEGFTLGWVWPP